MLKTTRIILSATLLALTAAATAAQFPLERQLEIAIGWAKIIGLSPEGSRLWAEDSLEGIKPGRLDAVTTVEIAIGDQLATERPDRKALDRLASQYASAVAEDGLRQKRRMLDTAFRLSASDRSKLGRFLARNARRELADRKPSMVTGP